MPKVEAPIEPTDELRRLIETVQHNCHISDARHAGDYTLCVYLLKMREFYRWEKQQAFNVELSTDDIGEWLTQREGQWDELDDAEFVPIELAGDHFDPYQNDDINDALREQGLVYSGGIGHKAKPHFFIGRLERHDRVDDYQIHVSAEEFARDLTSPPAMSQGKHIFIRRESFRRYIWEKTEEWRWNKPENAMARAIRCYDFDSDVATALDEMTDNELESTILHEIGEIRAGENLPGWSEMMLDLHFTPGEIIARAVRDHLADAISTLPKLIEEDNDASIHFYFANLTAMRKKIFPTLSNAYERWLEDHDIDHLNRAIEHSRTHWRDLGEEMLSLHSEHAERCSPKIVDLMEQRNL